MKHVAAFFGGILDSLWDKLKLGLRAKLIVVFIVAKVIPLVLLAAIAWAQVASLGNQIKDIAVSDSSKALNESAVENIERLTTDTAQRVATFLYNRDADILFLADIAAYIDPKDPDTYGTLEDLFENFAEAKRSLIAQRGEWVLASDGQSWVFAGNPVDWHLSGTGGISHNPENNDDDSFHYRGPEPVEYVNIPIYDEITFVDVDGNELVKAVAGDSTKVNYPVSREKKNVSDRLNTYVRAEDYFSSLSDLSPREIYVSDVIGAYVGSNYIGMYVPDAVEEAAGARGYDIDYNPEAQSYAGKENPNGKRYEGIIRWATPVLNESDVLIGYVTFALNHDHIMELVDHVTPMTERYTNLPSAFEGNYAFIWDYECRNIVHPRHNSIYGFDPETGDPQVPWLESSIYDAWQASGIENWTDYVRETNVPWFDNQSRSKTPAPALTKAGLVGLDGRYLNNAPQCTGWMDLTVDGGSGSFDIVWSGMSKLTTAAAIPYYTGQYAPSAQNGFSRRGFGFVTIGAGLEDFTAPAVETGETLAAVIREKSAVTTIELLLTTAVLIALVVFLAIWMATLLTNNITKLISGISRFRSGEWQFRFDTATKDEFGTLADSFDEMADSVVASVSNPLSITDLDHRIIYMNEHSLKICKTTLQNVVEQPYSSYSAYPADSKYDPILALKDGREAEIFFNKENNTYIRGTANFLLDKDGGHIGYIIVTADLTEMVNERTKIEEQRMLLDKVFSVSPDLIWYQDAKGAYFMVNPRFAALSGKSTEDIIGKTAADILPQEVARVFVKNDTAAMDSGFPLYTEEIVTFADGHKETLDSVRTPIYDAIGRTVGLLGFARDVTTRVSLENEYRSRQAKLELQVIEATKASEAKTEFITKKSKEISEPMKEILSLSDFILNEDVSVAVREQTLGVQNAGKNLLGVINDILDFVEK